MKKKLTFLALVWCGAQLTTGCRLLSGGSSGKSVYDSNVLKGTIPNGVLYSKSNNPSTWKFEIRQQLQYLVGQFNGDRAVTDMNQLKISVDEATVQRVKSGILRISYAARFPVTWARGKRWPIRYEAVLPKSGDPVGRRYFYQAYGAKCIDASLKPSFKEFYYRFRANIDSCPVHVDGIDKNIAVNTIVNFRKAYRNTKTKHPEYAKIWEDRKLLVTSVFETSKGRATHHDPGVRTMRETYEWLVQSYGVPKDINIEIDEDETLTPSHNDVRMKFDIEGKGVLDVQLLLTGSLADMSPEMEENYNRSVYVSDLVTINGKGSIGANLRALSEIGRYKNKQYQLFQVSGNDNFAYTDNSLQISHARGTPDASSSRYFDLITNARPDYFHANSLSSTVLIHSLVNTKHSFHQIQKSLRGGFDIMVTAEQDNAWPQKFPEN